MSVSQAFVLLQKASEVSIFLIALFSNLLNFTKQCQSKGSAALLCIQQVKTVCFFFYGWINRIQMSIILLFPSFPHHSSWGDAWWGRTRDPHLCKTWEMCNAVTCQVVWGICSDIVVIFLHRPSHRLVLWSRGFSVKCNSLRLSVPIAPLINSLCPLSVSIHLCFCPFACGQMNNRQVIMVQKRGLIQVRADIINRIIWEPR